MTESPRDISKAVMPVGGLIVAIGLAVGAMNWIDEEISSEMALRAELFATREADLVRRITSLEDHHESDARILQELQTKISLVQQSLNRNEESLERIELIISREH